MGTLFCGIVWASHLPPTLRRLNWSQRTTEGHVPVLGCVQHGCGWQPQNSALCIGGTSGRSYFLLSVDFKTCPHTMKEGHLF